MKVLFLILFVSLPSFIYAEGTLYNQHEIVAPLEQVKKWNLECDTGDWHGCYNVGVYYAQTLDDEKTAVTYYKKGCHEKHGLSCFNLGGILIKESETREEGIKVWRETCEIAKNLLVDDSYKESLAVACGLADKVEKNKELNYKDLIKKLNQKESVENINLEKSTTGQDCKKISLFTKEGAAFYKKKNYPKAIEAFKQQVVLSKECNISDSDLAITYNNIALAYLKNNDPLTASAYISLAPESKQSKFNKKLIDSFNTALIKKITAINNIKTTSREGNVSINLLRAKADAGDLYSKLILSADLLGENDREYRISLEKNYKAAKILFRAVKDNDKLTVSKMINYPLKRTIPMESVKNEKEFLEHYDEFFDINTFQNIKLNEKNLFTRDLGTVLMCNSILSSGDVWFNDGKITALWCETKAGKKFLETNIKKDKLKLHIMSRDYDEVRHTCNTKTHHIRIQYHKDVLHYFSWKRENNLAQIPDLALGGGELFSGGSGLNRYTFKSKEFVYTLETGGACADDCRDYLTVKVGEKEILYQACE
jgi:tetratricopeptide (TPR) repeat protein